MNKDDVAGLVERCQYIELHGIFDAANAGKMVTYSELIAALTTLSARVETLEAEALL